MRTISVIARKGGSGKTTVALNLAIAAHRRGLATVVADSDPQRSMADMLKGRREAGPTVVETSSRRLFSLQVSSLQAGTDALIIDTPAGEEEELAHAIVLSDLALFVVRPTLLDFASLIRTLKVVRHLQKPSLVVLNQAPPQRAGVEPPAVRKAHEALRLLGLRVSPAVLRTRAAYQAALETGSSAEERLDEAAAGEIRELWSSVERTAFVREHRQPRGHRHPIADLVMADAPIF